MGRRLKLAAINPDGAGLYLLPASAAKQCRLQNIRNPTVLTVGGCQHVREYIDEHIDEILDGAIKEAVDRVLKRKIFKDKIRDLTLEFGGETSE